MKGGRGAVIILTGVALAASCSLIDKEAKKAGTAREVRMLAKKLDRIILPSFPSSDVTLDQAIEHLRIKSRELDTAVSWPKGVNFVIISGGRMRLPKAIGAEIKNVSLQSALRRITGAVDLKYTVEPNAVAIRAVEDMRGASPPRTFHHWRQHLLP